MKNVSTNSVEIEQLKQQKQERLEDFLENPDSPRNIKLVQLIKQRVIRESLEIKELFETAEEILKSKEEE